MDYEQKQTRRRRLRGGKGRLELLGIVGMGCLGWKKITKKIFLLIFSSQARPFQWFPAAPPFPFHLYIETHVHAYSRPSDLKVYTVLFFNILFCMWWIVSFSFSYSCFVVTRGLFTLLLTWYSLLCSLLLLTLVCV